MKKRIIPLNLPAEKMLEKDVKGYNTDPDATFVNIPIDRNFFPCVPEILTPGEIMDAKNAYSADSAVAADSAAKARAEDSIMREIANQVLPFLCAMYQNVP